MKTAYDEVAPFVTKDGSLIRDVTSTGSEPLRILCVCHPPYADEDTVLL